VTQPCSRQQRDQTSYVESPKRPGESSRAVVVENTTDNPIPVTVDPAQNPVIYNISATANTATSQALTDGTKKILIKPRELATIKLSYDNSFTTFITIPVGNAYEINGIVSSSLTLYLESDTTTVIEVEEWT